MFQVNTEFEILTPTGFQDFYGLQQVTKQGLCTIITDNNTLQCAPSHRVKTPAGWKTWEEIKIGDEIFNSSGETEVVIDYDYSEEVCIFYDPVQVDGNEYITNNLVSHNCSFLGSMATLIDGKKLGVIPHGEPIRDNRQGLTTYADPEEDHIYVCCVDTSRGVDLDYSAFLVIDVTTLPYKVVARYRNNEVPSAFYPDLIYSACKHYNDAFCLVESNDVGKQVADILFLDLEYEHMFISQNMGRSGQQIGAGAGGRSKEIGLRMSKSSKRIGCMSIKSIIEMDKLIINDFLIKQELTTFVAKKASYEAEPGKHDDLVMCLVMFGWLTHQPYFKELTESDIRRSLLADNRALIEGDMLPVGFRDIGYDDHDMFGNDVDTAWEVVDQHFGRNF